MSREKAELQTQGKSEGPVGMRLSNSGGGRGCGRGVPVGEGCAEHWSLAKTLRETRCSLQPGPPPDRLPGRGTNVLVT